MEVKNIVELNSAKGQYEKKTDKFDNHKDRPVSFMAIRIMEPVIGGDTNNDGNIDFAEAIKGVGGGIANAVTSGSEFYTDIIGVSQNQTGGDGLDSNDPRSGVYVPPRPGGRRSSNTNTGSTVDIALPMPLEIPYEDSANWADDNTAAYDLVLAGAAQAASRLSDLGGNGLSAILQGLSATAFLDAARKIGQKKFGIGLEPRKELYYQGPEFRQFSFSWELAPKNRQEAINIRDTVNLIRKHSYPYRLSDTAANLGFEVWKLPSTFNISFRLGDSENPYLPKIKPCVVVSVSYNPTKEGSWRSFEDGAPVASTLSIQFKEVEVITQKDVDNGF